MNWQKDPTVDYTQWYTLVAADERRWLVTAREPSEGGWSFVRCVVISGKRVNRRKMILSLGHNGERWSESSEMEVAREKTPELLTLLEAELPEAFRLIKKEQN